MFFFNRKKNKKAEERNYEVEENLNVGESHKRVEVIHEPNTNIDSTKEKSLIGYILFKDRAFELTTIAEVMRLIADLNVNIDEDDTQSFRIETLEGTFICTHHEGCFPENKIDAALKVNSLEKDILVDIKSHQSYISITRVDRPFNDRLKACVIFNKIASVLLMQSNAAGIYLEQLNYLISPLRYARYFGQIVQAESRGELFFPIPLWIKIIMIREDSGIKAKTKGLSDFGLCELGLYETRQKPEEIFKVLMQLCDMYLIGQCNFQDGDTIDLMVGKESMFQLQEDILYLVEKEA